MSARSLIAAATLVLAACSGGGGAAKDGGGAPDAESSPDASGPACPPGGDGTYLTEFFPKLSDYCLVRIEGGEVKPLAGIPYDLNTTLFSDGAVKFRTIWMPPGTHATFTATRAFSFPTGTIITKSFGFRDDMRRTSDPVHWIETRLLVRTTTTWKAVAYLWSPDQTDADVDYAGGVDIIHFTLASGTPTTARYLVPDQVSCTHCHAPNKIMDAIGPKARNLNRTYPYADGPENQLTHWTKLGLLTGAPASPADVPALPVSNDPTSGSTTARARAYLEVNCAHCHDGGSGTASQSGLILWADVTTPKLYGQCKKPSASGHGGGDLSFDVVPGDPDHSILPRRMQITTDGLMPPEERSIVDREGLDLVRAWIRELTGTCP